YLGSLDRTQRRAQQGNQGQVLHHRGLGELTLERRKFIRRSPRLAASLITWILRGAVAPRAFSDLSPQCAPKRGTAPHSEFTGSRQREDASRQRAVCACSRSAPICHCNNRVTE